MDKEEFRAKQEEINRLVDKKDYQGAMAVVDTIEWRKVKNVRTLSVVGEIYAANKRYEESIEMFLLAYNRARVGKNILCRLIEISLKIDQFEEAEEFLEEFEEVAPNDHTRYLLKYKILKAQKAPLEEQIAQLEEYKEKEFTEKWAYELAKLYYKAGKQDQCIDLCDTMVLWFGDGPYVLKALDLKKRLGVLAGNDKEQYEQDFSDALLDSEDQELLEEEKAVKEEAEASEKETISVPSMEPSMEKESIPRTENGISSLQERLTKGLKDIFGPKKMAATEEELFADDLPEAESFPEPLNIKHSEEKEEDAPKLEPEHMTESQESWSDPDELEMEEENETELLAEEAETEKSSEFVFQQPEVSEEAASAKPESQLDPNLIRQIMVERQKAQEEEAAQEAAAVQEKNTEPVFNLEDAILAAASAQGIDVGEVSKGKDSEPSKEDVRLLEDEAELDRSQSTLAELPEALEEDKKEKKNPIGRFLKNAEKQLLIHVDSEEETGVITEANSDELEEFLEEADTSEKAEAVSLEEIEEPGEVSEEELEEANQAFEQELAKAEAVSEEVLEEDTEEALKEDTEESEEASEEDTEEPEEASEENTEEPEENVRIQSTVEFQREALQELKSRRKEAEKEPAKIIPRKRELTEEEELLFGYFVKVPGIREQILDTLCDVQMSAADKTSNAGNIVVMGGLETGKTQLISRLIPAICKELYMEATKVAYIYADQLNGRDMAKIVSKMSGGFLVIENVSLMEEDTVRNLSRAMEFRTDGLIVILEDEKNGMRTFLAKYPEFAEKFTSIINIPVFTNDELVNFASVYVQENGFFLDELGILALYNWIGENQKADEPMTIGIVKEKLDEVLRKARGGAGFRFLQKKRVEMDGLLALSEKDFN